LFTTNSGWWLTYPSEKYEFVSWDDEIPNIFGNIKNVSNHQPELVQIDHCRLETMQVLGVLAAGRWQTCSKKKSSKCKCCCTQKIPQEIP